jgi:hypothetical protein
MRYTNDRLEQRLEVDFPISVVGLDGRGQCRARNLSSGGVQLHRCSSTFKLGEDLELTLWLPETMGSIRCAGNVVYERRNVAGLCFEHMPLREQAAIDAFIEAMSSDDM